jgi:hypothetical protein
MNRYQRRAAEARRRAMKGNSMDNYYEDLWKGPVSDDIKRDIAKTVRSIDWTIVREFPLRNGLCFFRNVTGMVTLWKLGIAAKLALAA